MDNRFGLELQSLSRQGDKVLVVADLLTRRAGSFVSAEVTRAFLEFRVPPPANVSDVLAGLRRQDYVLRPDATHWALTPLGEQRVRDLAVEVAPVVRRAAEAVPGVRFADAEHTVIPAWAAPVRWWPAISRLLERFPFDRNVFVMTRFAGQAAPSAVVGEVLGAARAVLHDYGLTLHTAADHWFGDELHENIGAYMWACRYGLGLVEGRDGDGINHNVLIELGGMTLLGRRCAILKDTSVPRMPADLAAHLYHDLDFADPAAVTGACAHWAERTLGLSRIQEPREAR